MTSAALPVERESLSVYIHLPFCRVKCTYCAFAISTDLRLEERYISALIEELHRRLPQDQPVATLYFGGGTPSRTSTESLERLGTLIGRWHRAEDAEVTMEVNPEDVDEDRVQEWTEVLGVNRVSIGVQSFHDEELRPLGRQHGRRRAMRAIELAAFRVPRISLDLILGLPNQTVESVASSIEAAVESPAGHLSLYLLDLEPGSALERRVSSGLTQLPPDDRTAEMYRIVADRAEAAGLLQYEVSNFARPGEESVHNRRYWERKPYIGVGLGAHSFAGSTRSGNERTIEEYIRSIEEKGEATVFREELGEEEVRHEQLFLGLRQTAGLPLSELHSLAGESAVPWLEEGEKEGWITIHDERVRFTLDGFLLSDELLARLF